MPLLILTSSALNWQLFYSLLTPVGMISENPKPQGLALLQFFSSGSKSQESHQSWETLLSVLGGPFYLVSEKWPFLPWLMALSRNLTFLESF